MVSNRVKRNISGTLFAVGLINMAVRASGVVADFSSGKAWFEFISITILTWICYDSFSIYRRRVKNGIKFGSQKPGTPENPNT
ncbi:MAG: hypothetical protein NC102_08885 [Clostridium sp.]|nr:hypothetical protein [Clostridium sp.]